MSDLFRRDDESFEAYRRRVAAMPGTFPARASDATWRAVAAAGGIGASIRDGERARQAAFEAASARRNMEESAR